MPTLTTESLRKRLEELTCLYLGNQLYETFSHLDDIMQTYFEMGKVSEPICVENKTKVMLRRNVVRGKVRGFRYSVTPTNESYKLVPLCSCKTYAKDNSGLVIILMVGGTPENIESPFNRLYWNWRFFGDYWINKNPKRIGDERKKCSLQNVPSSIDTYYNPVHSLTYLLKNFERIQLNQVKEK